MNKLKLNIKNKITKIKLRIREISIYRYIKTNILFVTYVLINLINSFLSSVCFLSLSNNPMKPNPFLIFYYSHFTP